jgi:hypothetical protein
LRERTVELKSSSFSDRKKEAKKESFNKRMLRFKYKFLFPLAPFGDRSANGCKLPFHGIDSAPPNTPRSKIGSFAIARENTCLRFYIFLSFKTCSR